MLPERAAPLKAHHLYLLIGNAHDQGDVELAAALQHIFDQRSRGRATPNHILILVDHQVDRLEARLSVGHGSPWQWAYTTPDAPVSYLWYLYDADARKNGDRLAILLFMRYLQAVRLLKAQGASTSFAQGLPGIIGRDGWLATTGSTTPGLGLICRLAPPLITTIRLDVHFWWNIGETAFMLVAAHRYLRSVWEMGRSRGQPSG